MYGSWTHSLTFTELSAHRYTNTTPKNTKNIFFGIDPFLALTRPEEYSAVS